MNDQSIASNILDQVFKEQEAIEEETEKQKLDKKIKDSEGNFKENYSGFDKLSKYMQSAMIITNTETPDLKKQIFFLREEKKRLLQKENNANSLFDKAIGQGLINEKIIALRSMLMARDTEIEGFSGGISVSRKETKAGRLTDDEKVLEEFINIIKAELKNKEIKDSEIEVALIKHLSDLEKTLNNSKANTFKFSYEPITILQELLNEEEYQKKS